MKLKDAVDQAKKEANDGGYAQHVNRGRNENDYSVSDWYDSDSTCISFEGSREFNNTLTADEKKQINESKLRKLIKTEIKRQLKETKFTEKKKKDTLKVVEGIKDFNVLLRKIIDGKTKFDK